MSEFIVKLGIQVDSSDAVVASDNLDDLSRSAKRADKATDKLGKSAAKTAPRFKLQKNAMQQAGFQVQDFVVQVSAGQSAMVAFGQQGSQLAGVLGPGGAVFGAVIAIGAAIGGILVNSIGITVDAFDRFEEKIEAVRGKLDQLTIAQAKYVKILTSEELSALEKELTKIEREFEERTKFSVFNRDEYNKSKAVIELLKADIDGLSGKLIDLDAIIAGSPEKQKALFSNMAKGYQLLARTVEESNNKIAGDEAQERANSALTNALLFRGVSETAFIQESTERYNSFWAMFGESQLILSASYQDNLTSQLMSDEEYISSSLSAYQEYYATRNEAASTLKDAEDSLAKGRLETEKNLQGAFSTLMTAQSKELFEIGKAGSIASAIINGYEGVTKALAQGGIFGFASAAVVGAAAAVQVANIASTKFGTTSMTTSLPSAPNTQDLAPAPNVSNITIDIGGAEFFSRETVLKLIDGINESVADGATLRAV